MGDRAIHTWLVCLLTFHKCFSVIKLTSTVFFDSIKIHECRCKITKTNTHKKYNCPKTYGPACSSKMSAFQADGGSLLSSYPIFSMKPAVQGESDWSQLVPLLPLHSFSTCVDMNVDIIISSSLQFHVRCLFLSQGVAPKSCQTQI